MSSLPAPPVTIYPSSNWEPRLHPRAEQVIEEVDKFFLDNWPFPNDKARKRFVGAGFSRATCYYMVQALDDRLHFACRLLTLLFLIDDILEHMSLEDGRAYNAKLMPISRGTSPPDRAVPVERITYDLWASMRAHDGLMADDILEPVFVFMRAQTDPVRLRPLHLGEYLEYRQGDVGQALLAALMRFTMALSLTPEETLLVQPVDRNTSKHISVVNDIWSFDKELLVATSSDAEEGAALCSAVSIVAAEAEVSPAAAKRVLYGLCREWEVQHDALVGQVLAQRDTPALRAYLKGLGYQMSGNEVWSRTTLRYKAPRE